MMRYLVYLFLVLLLFGFFTVDSFVYAEETTGATETADECKGIRLNTNVPFVGNCISFGSDNDGAVNSINAFPRLLQAMSSLTMTIILVFCFMAILIGGVLITTGGMDESNVSKGKDMIRHVVIALALLGASGIILRLVNPNFFG